jgi:hypothetical protein
VSLVDRLLSPEVIDVARRLLMNVDSRCDEQMTAAVGTLDWALETRGRLSAPDRARLLAQALLVESRSWSERVLRRLGLARGRLADVDLDALRIPDSPVCRDADKMCAEQTPPVVLLHSQRSYVWSAIVAAHDGIAFDEELLWVAALLHDLGFVDRGAAGTPECFTLVGARAALGLDADGWDDARRRSVAEAITLHLNLRVDLSHGPEPHLLWAGTRLDAVGLRHWDIAPAAIASVLERYPRLDLKNYFPTVFEKEATLVPGSRTHFYTRYLGASGRVRRAPLP